jgi:DNA topoisomerase II
MEAKVAFSCMTVTGGRNGYGAKLTNIYSTTFTIETTDGKKGQRYRQTFEANMSVKNAPLITSYSGPDYTQITFVPDLRRFGMTALDSDTVGNVPTVQRIRTRENVL